MSRTEPRDKSKLSKHNTNNAGNVVTMWTNMVKMISILDSDNTAKIRLTPEAAALIAVQINTNCSDTYQNPLIEVCQHFFARASKKLEPTYKAEPDAPSDDKSEEWADTLFSGSKTDVYYQFRNALALNLGREDKALCERLSQLFSYAFLDKPFATKATNGGFDYTEGKTSLRQACVNMKDKYHETISTMLDVCVQMSVLAYAKPEDIHALNAARQQKAKRVSAYHADIFHIITSKNIDTVMHKIRELRDASKTTAHSREFTEAYETLKNAMHRLDHAISEKVLKAQFMVEKQQLMQHIKSSNKPAITTTEEEKLPSEERQLLVAELADTINLMADRDRRLKAQDRHIADMTTEMDELDQDNDQLEKEAATLTEEVEKLQGTNQKLDEELQQQKATQGKLQSQLAYKAMAQTIVVQAMVRGASKVADTAEARAGSAVKKAEEVGVRAEAAKAQADAAKEQVIAQTNENLQLKAELERMKKELEETRKLLPQHRRHALKQTCGQRLWKTVQHTTTGGAGKSTADAMASVVDKAMAADSIRKAVEGALDTIRMLGDNTCQTKNHNTMQRIETQLRETTPDWHEVVNLFDQLDFESFPKAQNKIYREMTTDLREKASIISNPEKQCSIKPR